MTQPDGREGGTDEAIDLVVAGSGAAGLTGAVTAALSGLRVCVLEKTTLLGGTTSKSGGAVWIPCNHHMPEVGVDDTPQDALDYLRACSGTEADDRHLVALATHGAAMIRRLEADAGLRFRPWPAEGPTYDYRPWLPGARHGGRALMPARTSMEELGYMADAIRTDPYSVWTSDPLDYYVNRDHLRPPAAQPAVPAQPDARATYGRGTALVAQLTRACLRHDVEFRMASAVEQLVVESGSVVGVRTATGTLRARRGVLMATGGYSHNAELLRHWIARPLVDSCEAGANQGDGHLAALRVGAQLSGLGDAWWMPRTPQPAGPGDANIGGSKDDRVLPHVIVVNAAGRRFMNEAVNYYDAGEAFGLRAGAAGRNFPAWMIFDQQGVQKYAVLASKAAMAGVSVEVVSGQTLEDLARSAGIYAEGLRRTVTRFNGFARAGVDEDFGRGGNDWDRGWGDPGNAPNPSLGSLEASPFFAVPLYPGALATRGGLCVDERARVLSVDGTPIEGLYAAGNCSSGGPTGSYPGPGATLGAAMTFGYLAAMDAAST